MIPQIKEKWESLDPGAEFLIGVIGGVVSFFAILGLALWIFGKPCVNPCPQMEADIRQMERDGTLSIIDTIKYEKRCYRQRMFTGR